MGTFQDFFEAYSFLQDHYIFEDKRLGRHITNFDEAYNIMVVKVNPRTNTVDDDEALNTETRVWIECGGYFEEDGYKGFNHDIDLDTGGRTFEEAIINLANLVKEKHGLNPEGFGEVTEEERAKTEEFMKKLRQR